ncbi:MAG: hypothetical protein ACYDCN_04810 [Bacteroidia bacterium]
MKFIEKSRLETFLKLKGYKVDSNGGEQKKNTCWQKSEKEKISIPRKDVFQSNDLPKIFDDENLLKEFRKF